jgi:Zn-dependent peptidase ImmA (M78 family)
MSRSNIQQEVALLHREIWKQKEVLWPNRQLMPLQMLEPDAAAYLLDVEYLTLPNLGSTKFMRSGQGPGIAGLIDRQANKIAISMAYPEQVQRFTGAHEVGHFMLHEGQIMLRDRPLDGSANAGHRSDIEREADYFAACILMPPNLLTAHFEAQFGRKGAFKFTETTSFHLCHNDPDSLQYASQGSLGREFALARCESFGGRRMNSLAKQFRVSDSAMALRIKELGLVVWP